MDFRIALKSDKPQIYRLWQEAFGDGKKIIDRFFESIISFDNIAVCADGSKIVAMLSLLPVKIVSKNTEDLTAFCVYAAATDIEYRKKGIMSELISFASALSKKRNADFLFLHPANESLYDYYEKNGFEKAFYVKSKVHFSEISEDISYSYVHWSEVYYKLNSELSDNSAFFCEYGYADYSVCNGEITVNTFSGGNVKELLKELSDKTGSKNIFVSMPADSSTDALPQGMIKRLSDKKIDNNIYMGITLE